MTLSILHDSGATIIRHRRAMVRRSDLLVVSFTGFEGSRNDMPGFGEELIARSGHDCIAFKMHERNNYADLSFEDVARIVGPVAAGYREVMTYGSSGGAYAAIYFSEAVGASFNLAISPRNTRDPRYARRETPLRDLLRFRHRRLIDLPPKRATTLVIYDPTQTEDEEYMAREVRPLGRLHEIAFPLSFHPSTRVLGDVRQMKPLLAGVLGALPDQAAAIAVAEKVVAAAKQRRHHSNHHFLLLAQMALGSREPARFDRIAPLARLDEMNAEQLGILAGLYRRRRRLSAFRAQLQATIGTMPSDGRETLEAALARCDRFELDDLGDVCFRLPGGRPVQPFAALAEVPAGLIRLCARTASRLRGGG